MTTALQSPISSVSAEAPTAEWYQHRVPLLRSWRKGFTGVVLEDMPEAARRGGDFVRFKAGPLHFYLISDPDAIEYVLVKNWRNYGRGEPDWSYVTRGVGKGLITSDGELHERQRRLISPVFQPRRIQRFADFVSEELDRTLSRWHVHSGEVVDLADDMTRFTLLVMAQVLFGIDLESEAEELGQAVTDVNAAAGTVDASATGFLYFMPTRANRRFRRALKTIDALAARLIREQEARGPEDNVLSMLLAAREDPEGMMTDRQLRDELVTLFGAGHETTSNLLCWTWWLLAENPEAEARLHEELDQVLGGRPATFEDLPNLPYTDRVLKESMRIYPPVWGNQRVSTGDDVVAGRALPAGSMVTPLPWIVHRDARWYPDPLRFEPDRFTPEAMRARPRFSYFPFGGGDRVCVGQAFAEMEGRLALATLAQHFTPRALEGYQVEPEAMVSLRPKGGLPMRLVPRSAVA